MVVTAFVEEKRDEEWKMEIYLTYMKKRKDLTLMELIHFAYEGDVWFELSK